MTVNTMILTIIFMPMAASVVSYWIGMVRESYRNVFLMAMMVVEAFLTYHIYGVIRTGEVIWLTIPGIMGTGFVLKCDLYRFVFVAIAVFAWFVTMMYSFLYLIKYNHRNRYFMFFTLTLSATVGFFLSANIINMFTFFEILTIALYLLIIHDEDEYSHEAGSIYLNMAIFGGLIQLLGIFMLYAYTGTFMIDEVGAIFAEMGAIKYIIAIFIFIGYAVKASCFPLHVWLPKAHPAAPSPASAVLSGVMLKCGVFGIIMVANDFLRLDHYFAAMLMVIAYANIILTGIMAMFQRNLKRIMAFSSMSQIGFILLGVALLGVDENYAAYGTLLYIINHSIYKVLLFLCAGVIYTLVKDLSLNHLKGFGRGKYILFVLFMAGTLGLTAFPGFNGYLGKTLLYHALEHYVAVHGFFYRFLLILFDVGSMITVAYALKMMVAIFIWKAEETPPKTSNKWIYFPLFLLAFAIYYEGTHPTLILTMLGDAAIHLGGTRQFHYDFYEIENLMHSAVIFLFGGLIYIFFINGLLRKNENGKWMYVNPSMHWVSAERLLYQPSMAFVLRVVPRAIMHLDARLSLLFTHVMTALMRSSNVKFKTTSDREYTLKTISFDAMRWLKTVSGSMLLALLATMLIYMVLTLV
jgi:formate hydrogenlyase subunit 3/multisubunit Na+/H+ antiporter MnhD subunit